ncbi:B12-binding domain-containing radical SAM protein [Pelotalea chapellei]|uniref:B12-binding domain-containing radical SAM protein n=1 Tax=Pelotalea chapellei TaxID=44671 RepID=A0ABS5UCE2_9BACT|nr:B12-binding domain-containing radical SAM protein [Pelotalea chapellei]
MRIVMVAIHPYPSPQAIPLSNAFLQSYLAANHGIAAETQRADFYLSDPTETCAAELEALQPDAISFSIYVWNRSKTREIAALLKKRLPKTIIFAGGPETTADPEGVLAEICFDFLIIGEGEIAFKEVCTRLASSADLNGIAGVLTRTTPPHEKNTTPLLQDLDAIPSPWLTGVLDSRSYRGILWQLSRGCGFTCDFCFDSRGIHGVRRFSLDRIKEELRLFASTEVSQVFVLDSTFNMDIKRAKEILRLIKKFARGIHFHFEIRSEFIDREMARLFADITCSLQIGLQSSNAQVMKNVGRVFNREDFTAKVDILNQVGAVFGFDLMYGLPGDTLSGFTVSLDYALSLYPNHLDIFPLAILPGTALAARSGELGLHYLAHPPYTLISSPTFDELQMEHAHRLAQACSIFYTRGKSVAWFNSLIVALNTKPSIFLTQFDEWIRKKAADITEAELSDEEIWHLQRDFISQLLTPKKLKRLLPLVLDLVDYHFYYAAAMQASLPSPLNEQELQQLQVLDLTCQLASSTRMASFNYEILDILEAGEPIIRTFIEHHQKHGSHAVIYPTHDGIATESLIEPYYRLLEHLDPKTPCRQIAAQLNIPKDEAASFLEFALAEGIIIKA